jgi:hypothetical protein
MIRDLDKLGLIRFNQRYEVNDSWTLQREGPA